MFYRMSEQELNHLIKAYVESRIDTDKFLTIKRLRTEYPTYYNLLIDYFITALIDLNAEIFLAAHGHSQALSKTAQEELLRAAGDNRRLIFHRPLQLSDFVLTSAFIFAETLLPAIAVLLYSLANSEEAGLAVAAPLLIERGVEYIAKMGDYLRKIKELPEFDGMEHCVFIKASVHFGTLVPFSLDDLRKAFSDRCDIPVARHWDCWARPVDPLAAHNSCDALVPKHSDLLYDAVKSLVRKGYLAPESDFNRTCYFIPRSAGSPA